MKKLNDSGRGGNRHRKGKKGYQGKGWEPKTPRNIRTTGPVTVPINGGGKDGGGPTGREKRRNPSGKENSQKPRMKGSDGKKK